MNLKSLAKRALVSAEMEEYVDNKLPKAVGSFGYDPWGYNTDTAKIGLTMLKFLHDKYFRVEAFGLERIPKKGRVLIIANHSGQLPMDGVMLSVSLALNPHAPRAARAMVERFFPTVPVVNTFLSACGAVVGDPYNCGKMLEREEAVIVFPEGVRGSGKLYKNRYKLQRFGNGFMHLAMMHKAPILPVGIVGCEETMPALAQLKPLGKMLGLPYFPVALPFFLPAKVFINIGEPMHFKGDIDNEDDVTRKVEEVKAVISRLIKTGLSQRKGIF